MLDRGDLQRNRGDQEKGEDRHLDRELRGDFGAQHAPERGADRDEGEQPPSLRVVEAVRHEAPEDRDHE